jgi:hypothetical protein
MVFFQAGPVRLLLEYGRNERPESTSESMTCMRRSNRCVRMMNRTVMQGRKESLWSQLLGVTYALTVVFAPGEGQVSISLGGHEWVDAAVSRAVGWWRSRRCCWGPRTASGRRTSWTSRSGG